MNTEQFDSIPKRTIQYWYSDGLAEIAGSFLFVLLATYFWLQIYLPLDSPLRLFLDVSFILIILGGSYLTGKITNITKARITYPRTGFVQYKADPETKNRRRLLSIVLVSALVAVAALIFFVMDSNFNWMAAATGILLGIMVIGFVAPRVGLLRFYLYGVLSAVTGVLISLYGFENILGLAIFYSLAAGVLLVSGMYTLIRYLQLNKIQVENFYE